MKCARSYPRDDEEDGGEEFGDLLAFEVLGKTTVSNAIRTKGKYARLGLGYNLAVDDVTDLIKDVRHDGKRVSWTRLWVGTIVGAQAGVLPRWMSD